MRALALFAALFVLGAQFAAADELIAEYRGADQQTMRPFTVDGPWEIQWEAAGAAFSVHLYRAEGEFVGIAGSQRGGGTGSSYQPLGGSFYLALNAVGPWVVRVVRITPPAP